ncbi:UAA transporter, partial [Ramicandelaber brevisporus]
ALFSLGAWQWVVIYTLIFGGCCSNVFTLELLTLDGIGDWVEQLIVGILPRWIPRLKARKIPAYRWMVMVFLFFVVSVLNNWALGFEISVPLHIIFRSGGLIVNMIMGWLIVSKRYSQRQIFAVIFVTLGVVLATFAASNVSESFLARYGVSVEWVTGIAILTIALVFSALLGLFQEFTYRRYGNQWREGLFYSHFYALPFFLMFYSDIVKSIHEFNDSAPIDFIGTIPIVGQLLGQQDTLAGSDAIDNNNVDAMMQYRLIPPVMVPSLWVYCFWNMVTQYFCIAGVHRMTGVATSLTLNLVLNVRKLVSLVLSIILFSNPFTAEMSYGCFMVIIGTAMYS